jgi:anti-sigma B factor antagonist
MSSSTGLPDFSISESVWPDGATVVSLSGEIDLETAPEVKTVLDRLAVSKPRTILDLADVSFIDSTGLTMLLRVVQRAAKEGWSLALAPKLSEPVARLLELTNTYQLLPIDGEH